MEVGGDAGQDLLAHRFEQRIALGCFSTFDALRHPRRDVQHFLAALAGPHRGMDGTRQLLAVVDRLLQRDMRFDLTESFAQAEAHIAEAQIQAVQDVAVLDLALQLGRQDPVEVDAVGEAGLAALADTGHAAQNAGQVQFVVVAVVEVPGQPRRDFPALEHHDVALTRGLPDLDDAGMQGLTRAGDGGNRMVLERAEHRADLHLQPAVGLDILEDDHAAVGEHLPELIADLLVGQCGEGDAGDARTKREVLAQGPDVDG